jgi:hypothetical protein
LGFAPARHGGLELDADGTMASQAEDEASPPAADDSQSGIIDEPLPISVLHQVGDVVAGRYRLTALLGRGGMGDVWRAHDETLEIEVALKLIRAEEDADDSEDRLLREARIAAKLGHPAIVRIFDFGRSELDEPFIVMELLEGIDLAKLMRKSGPVNALKAVRIILPIVHALGAAHAKGIVHRDLKPDNIFLAKLDGDQFQPKLVDFGIAKLDRSKASRLTRTGALIGSPTYMSPEQGRGDEVDHRADIWSICVVLYEMVAGYPPFQGKNSHALLYAIMVSDPEPIPMHAPSDEALWQIIARGLEKDWETRWPSARDLGVALAEWLRALGVTEDIAGASLDAAWGNRAALFDSIAPVGELTVDCRRTDATTIVELESPVPPKPRRGRLAVVAVVLALLGVAVGILVRLPGFVSSGVLQGGPQTEAPPLATTAPIVENAEPQVNEPDPGAPAEASATAAIDAVPSASVSAPSVAPAAPRPRPKQRVWRPAPKTKTGTRPKMKDPFQ